ncbi:hypothetical protein [Meiothermus ruber]|nr:hypothetical protein [Meiothermus ruber]GAO74793.1 putative uncharacterized protein [Meiothermus ruber H328]
MAGSGHTEDILEAHLQAQAGHLRAARPQPHALPALAAFKDLEAALG